MREPTEVEKNEAKYFAQLDLDDLYVVVGRASEGRSGVQFSPDRARAQGKTWFESHRDILFHKVCEDWEYCKKRRSAKLTDPITLAVALADLIIAACGGIPPLAVSTLLLKIGLDRFCGCDEDR